ncbi:MAG: tail fiber domain-containing protein [Phycisphaerae bacterium]|nr:tail fiber domain-containing protein [Phycisphaerae bacterium]
MKRANWAILMAGIALGLGSHAGWAAPMGTAFSYQGQLTRAGVPVNDSADFEFRLYTQETDGSQVGSMVPVNDVDVVNGQFTARLDFGSGAFTGDARWLEIGVRVPSGSGGFTTLDPRQEVTPAPHAVHAASAGNAWNLTGNAGTTAATNFLGTTDNVPLVFKSWGLRVFRLEAGYGGYSPNVIGGYSGNSVTTDVYGATIGGGGEAGQINRVTDDFGTVGGGRYNQAGDNLGHTYERIFATVSGGTGNTASGKVSTVGGGASNNATDQGSTIGGGDQNDATAAYATIGGGQYNIADGENATIGGGKGNDAIGANSTVAGGDFNEATGANSTVGGGETNIASGSYATVPGGFWNTAGGNYSFAGGRQAKANHAGSFVWADSQNADFSSTDANQFLIRAAHGVGINMDNPEADLCIHGDTGIIRVSNDTTGTGYNGLQIGFVTTGSVHVGIWNRENGYLKFGTFDQERMRINEDGKVGIGRVAATNRLEVEGTASKSVAGDWLANSDRRIKTDIETIHNALDTLDRVRLVNFRYTDEYRAEHEEIADQTYMNVIAQEFQEVFPNHVKASGDRLPSGEPILQVDSYPLTVYSAAAVQELHTIVNEQNARIVAQQEEIEALRTRLTAIEAMVAPRADSRSGGAR